MSELATTQSLIGVDPDLIAQRERSYFVCVDGAVFSKDFAAKAQAMKTVSLGKVSIVALAILSLHIPQLLLFYTEVFHTNGKCI
jgi:hypothetical protein